MPSNSVSSSSLAIWVTQVIESSSPFAASSIAIALHHGDVHCFLLILWPRDHISRSFLLVFYPRWCSEGTFSFDSLTTIYGTSDNSHTPHVVGVSSTPVDNFAQFSTALGRLFPPSDATVSATTDTLRAGVS